MNTQQLRTLGQVEAVGTSGCAIIARPDDGVWFDVVPGESATIRVHSGTVGGRYTIMEHRIAPEASPPLHSHVEDEIFEVLDGVVTFLCSGDQFEGSAGKIVVIPADAAHTWANLFGKPARIRTMFTPAASKSCSRTLQALARRSLWHWPRRSAAKFWAPA